MGVKDYGLTRQYQLRFPGAENGRPLDQVMPRLLQRLAGKVVLVHHAAVERQFLERACRNLYASGFVATWIDTEALARRQLERRNQPYRPGDLRLAARTR